MLRRGEGFNGLGEKFSHGDFWVRGGRGHQYEFPAGVGFNAPDEGANGPAFVRNCREVDFPARQAFPEPFNPEVGEIEREFANPGFMVGRDGLGFAERKIIEGEFHACGEGGG